MYYWIGKKYKVTKDDAPKCKCPKPCRHYLSNKASRRMLRAKAKRQNSAFGEWQHEQWDEVARLMPVATHSKERRARFKKNGGLTKKEAKRKLTAVV